MEEEINENSEASTEQDNTKSDCSRREFLTRSTGTVAAASAIAAGSAVGLMVFMALASTPPDTSDLPSLVPPPESVW